MGIGMARRDMCIGMARRGEKLVTCDGDTGQETGVCLPAVVQEPEVCPAGASRWTLLNAGASRWRLEHFLVDRERFLVSLGHLLCVQKSIPWVYRSVSWRAKECLMNAKRVFLKSHETLPGCEGAFHRCQEVFLVARKYF